MHARVATFRNDPDNIDDADREDPREHRRRPADDARAGRREVVEFYEVAIHTLDQR